MYSHVHFRSSEELSLSFCFQFLFSVFFSVFFSELQYFSTAKVQCFSEPTKENRKKMGHKKKAMPKHRLD